MSLIRNPCGSLWHRWDPHIHAPGTILNDQFGGDWEEFLRRIETATPAVRALGVSDYYSIACYREVARWKAEGRLPEVEFLFPNVELRLDIRTDKGSGLNVHLLFSPEDPEHERHIERILSRLTFSYRERTYSCGKSQLIELGHAFDATHKSEMEALRCGAEQFKVSWTQLREVFRTESWLEDNCLIGVVGTLSDGTAGLQRDHSFGAMRREIERLAHLIFGATPGLRDFWLGRKPGFPRKFIEERYGSLKACLHGSDPHRMEQVATPDQNRYCWIKGDLVFETLRQVVVEPEERVWIGEQSPSYSPPSIWIREVRTHETPWFKPAKIALNPGLVAVIGARGSGKTALVDIVAAGAGCNSASYPKSSFLDRASEPVNYLRDARVVVQWGDGEEVESSLDLQSYWLDRDEMAYPQVCYLSQHFVEQLCSAEGLATELRAEMERVIFSATEPTDRREAGSFAELADAYLDPIRRMRNDLRMRLGDTSDQIERESAAQNRLPSLQKERDAKSKDLDKERKRLGSLLPKGKEERARRLAALEEACKAVEAKVESLKRRLALLKDLELEIVQLRETTEPHRLAAMRRRYHAVGLSPDDWKAFQLQFSGDVVSIIEVTRRDLEAEIRIAESGDGMPVVETAPLSSWPLKLLREARDAVKKEVGLDTEKQRNYDLLQRSIGQLEGALRKLELEIGEATQAGPRREELRQLRRDTYAQVFETLKREEDVLHSLYAPLEAQLEGAGGALAKLRFVVRREVDVATWVEAGESLLDLRRESRLRGVGTLRGIADETLVLSWRTGGADEVSRALHTFLEQYGAEFAKALHGDLSADGRRERLQELARWLFSTEHIRIQYAIEYDGVAIEQLSPGTRGIVLLLLYLAIDKHDRRPLVIDQPEENLDPNSVYEELVPHFREARKRRQVVIVTHNANLVVNTDADQVVVATSERTAAGGLPRISYQSGSLENSAIRTQVCEILEGGERAFLEREKRYRLRWGDAIRRSGVEAEEAANSE